MKQQRRGRHQAWAIQQTRRYSARVVRILKKHYAQVDLGNKTDPLDELIFIILSQMTTSTSYVRVFDRLKAAFPKWDTLANVHLSLLKRIVKDAGLSNQKAPRIRIIVRRLIRDFGHATLQPLQGWDDHSAETYLAALPGVGIKTAKCVLMYSMGRAVLPIDTHVARVAARLGLLDKPGMGQAAHRLLENHVSRSDRYGFHVYAVVHGRQTCKHARPKCAACPLAEVCMSAYRFG